MEISSNINGAGGATGFDASRAEGGQEGAPGRQDPAASDRYIPPDPGRPLWETATNVIRGIGAFLLGAVACNPVEHQAGSRTPDSRTGPEASQASTQTKVEPPKSLDFQAVFNHAKRIEVTIPPEDSVDTSVRDFMAFCKKRSLNCAFDTHGKVYGPGPSASPADEVDLMRISDMGGNLCRPKEGYHLKAYFKSYPPPNPHEPHPNNLPAEGGKYFIIDSLNEIPLPCETDSHPFCRFNGGNGVTINELLRAIMQNPGLLEIVKQEKQLVATGSLGVATLPKGIKAEAIRTEKDKIPGKSYWYFHESTAVYNCEDGTETYLPIPLPDKMVHYKTNDERKDGWFNLNAMEVLIRWEESSQTFRITYGKPYGLGGDSW